VIPGALALACGIAIGYLAALAQLEHLLRCGGGRLGGEARSGWEQQGWAALLVKASGV